MFRLIGFLALVVGLCLAGPPAARAAQQTQPRQPRQLNNKTGKWIVRYQTYDNGIESDWKILQERHWIFSSQDRLFDTKEAAEATARSLKAGTEKPYGDATDSRGHPRMVKFAEAAPASQKKQQRVQQRNPLKQLAQRRQQGNPLAQLMRRGQQGNSLKQLAQRRQQRNPLAQPMRGRQQRNPLQQRQQLRSPGSPQRLQSYLRMLGMLGR